MTATPKPFPRDGRLISLILASKGIEDADERVIHQLLDFAHRYTADVLQSAQSLSDHAARSGPSSNKIEKEDVELAVQMRKRYEFFEAPPRDYLATLAHELNSQPLPILPESFDLIRLPPPHQRLSEVNFDIVPDAELSYSDVDDADAEADEDDEEDDEDDDDAEGEGEGREGGEDDGDGEEDDEDMDQDQPHRTQGETNGAGEDAMGEDEDMAEVGITPQAPRQDREVDEDYDV